MMNETMALLTGLLGTLLGIMLFGAALGGAFMLGRGWHRRDRVLGASGGDDVNTRRIAEMMTRIEELALEVERSAETQRYVAKMLAAGAKLGGAGGGRSDAAGGTGGHAALINRRGGQSGDRFELRGAPGDSKR